MSHDQTWFGAVASSSGLAYSGCTSWLRRSRTWSAEASQAVHGPDRAQVFALLVEELRVDRRGCQVHEALVVQRGEHPRAFLR